MKVFYLFKELFVITLGCIIAAIGISCFLLPNNLTSGGFSGIALVFYYLFEAPISLVIILMNIPLFIVGYIKSGKRFFVKSLYCTIMYSKFIDYFAKITVINNKFFASIYGGLFIGIGMSLILKQGCTTGGTDLIAFLLQDYKINIKMSKIILALDFIIILLNIIVFKDYEIGMYSLITIYIIEKIINLVLEEINN